MKFFIYYFLVCSVVLTSLAVATPAFAAGLSLGDKIWNNLVDLGQDMPNQSSTVEPATSFPILIGKFIRTVLAGLTIGLAGLIFYGGYLYSTSRGDKKQAEKGREWITNAVLGVIVCFAVYVITEAAVSAFTSLSIQ